MNVTQLTVARDNAAAAARAEAKLFSTMSSRDPNARACLERRDAALAEHARACDALRVALAAAFDAK